MPVKSSWLLMVCAVLEAMISVIYLSFHARHGTVVFLGELTLTAGICAVACGLWSSGKSASWLLVLNGVACSVLGVIFAFWTGPLSFRTVAFLVAVMAISLGVYELETARALRRTVEKWLAGGAGLASMGFALVFLGFALRWIKLAPESPAQTLEWLGAYFGFSAICMLLLALRLPRMMHAPTGSSAVETWRTAAI
jgi:uncharacterized membrane protein HdeD (DUF308 family)